MLKTWVFILSFFLLSPLSAYTIISDLDDTIKITHSDNVVTGAYHGALTKKMFSGMKTYLSATEQYRQRFFIVTASPSVLRPQVRDLFQSNNLKTDGLFLRSDIRVSKLNYKIKTIAELMETFGDDVVLIGDDVGADPEVYQEIQKRFPERVLAIYIRPIKNRPFTGQRIHTTFDLAKEELWFGRISLVAVLDILEEHLKDKIELLVPRFAWCPTTSSSPDRGENHLFPDLIRLQNRLHKHCQ